MIAGCNISNVLVFTPWLILNLSSLIYVFPIRHFPLRKPLHKLMLCTLFGSSITVIIIYPFNDINTLIQFFSDVILGEWPIFVYMLLALTMGLTAVNFNAFLMTRFERRKAFHLVAFVLFVPPIMHAAYNKPRLLVLAMNSVTVALIGIELLRHNGAMSKGVSDWFKSFCEDRERIPDVMIVTHIYLLMGCALPVSITYILLSGSLFPSEWTLYSLSGVVFLGIGDSCVSKFPFPYFVLNFVFLFFIGCHLWKKVWQNKMEGTF